MSAPGLLNWLRLRDYDDALREARTGVIQRFARGNVSIQNGNLLDDDALDALRKDGDRAVADLLAQRTAAATDGKDFRIR